MGHIFHCDINITIKELTLTQKEVVEDAMSRNCCVQAWAARELGITQRQIGYKIKKYGIVPPEHICVKSN
ncbi:MAG TPA: hypothetical protein ENG80_05430 [Nitrospirae bacterium]|nr:hypothetical protein [Nitrospirota bacterium]